MLRTPVQILLNIVGFVLNFIGLAGVPEDVQKWGEAMTKLHSYVNDPIVYLPLMFVGTLLIAVTWALWISGYRLKRAGGITGREWAANFTLWDKVRSFPIWQVSWLWNDLEPQSEETQGTSAYPTFRRLKEHLDQGLIEGLQRIQGSWLNATPPRQLLIDYALKINERPKFLFPKERSPYLIRKIAEWFRNEVAQEEIKEYRDFSTLEFNLATHLVEEGENEPHLKAWSTMKFWLESGEYEAIGRRRDNDMFYHYERIPQWKWEHMDKRFGSIRWGREEYINVMVRRID